jgi:hypothetical protein
MDGCGLMIEKIIGDGPNRFCLTIRQLEALQNKRDCGPVVLWRRLVSGEWRTDDVYHTLRFGLIGGGMDANVALQWVESHLQTIGILDAALLAAEILDDALRPREDDPAGKTSAPQAAAEVTQKSGSAHSMEPAPH